MNFDSDQLNSMEQLDLFVLDQLLKKNITSEKRILDAGCGKGTHFFYFLKNGFLINAIDQDGRQVQSLKKNLVNQSLNSDCIECQSIEKMQFPNRTFDYIFCMDVFHLAKDQSHLEQMWNQLWRVLKYGGMLFVKLYTTIGIEKYIQQKSKDRYQLENGQELFLVDEMLLQKLAEKVNAVSVEPMKTVISNHTAITYWVISKIMDI